MQAKQGLLAYTFQGAVSTGLTGMVGVTGTVGMAAREVGGNAAHSGLEGVRVLLVEDSWQVADALSLLLEKTGMIVAGPVATAREAKGLVAAHRPTLAIVDVNLKGEMAYGLMDWLNEQGIQVLVISGYADLPQSLGRFAAILHKPFTAAALLTTLRRMNQRQSNPAYRP